MSKKIILSTVLFISFLLLICSLDLLAQEASSPTAFPKIVYIENEVMVNLSGAEWVPAQKGMVLQQNSAIKTGDKAYCDIALDESLKNIVSLGPNTEFKMGEHFNRIHILKGRVFTELKKLKEGSSFQVVTPQAIAGVRGTAWESLVDALAQFNVKDETIFVQGLGTDGAITGESDVTEGYSLTVDETGWLGQLLQLSQEDWDRMNNWSQRIEQSLSSEQSSSQGQSFQQIIQNEVLGEGDFVSDDEFVSDIFDGEFSPGIPGSDITAGTFPPPVVESSTSESSQPSTCDCVPSNTNPNCSC